MTTVFRSTKKSVQVRWFKRHSTHAFKAPSLIVLPTWSGERAWLPENWIPDFPVQLHMRVDDMRSSTIVRSSR